ncbi:MAG TPA: FAD-dependent oxidoreductase, partial [Pseudomonadales bacterium]|nr:FAD-dependent oxidoreductase [Pseudomonadales bacterium]
MSKKSTASRWRIWVLVGFVALIISFFALGFQHYLTLDFFKSQQQNISEQYAAHPFQIIAIYFVAYVAVTAMSLPGAAIMTLVAGALFGTLLGTLIVSFASTIGATLAFLSARFVVHDWAQKKFADKLRAVNDEVKKDGAFYLFTLRLAPAFPFFAVNLLMALTPIRTFTFYWVSQIGMLAGTFVYVNAGKELAQIDSLKGILSPSLLLSFSLLGFFPLIAKKMLNALKARKIYKSWPKPARFDRNLIVIGAGSAGLVTAYIAAAVKAKVTLIEKHKMGGDCLNTGCVPSKALIRAAKVANTIKHAAEFGVEAANAHVNFAAVMQRVRDVIRAIEPHDSVERYTGLGVECLQGSARLISPYEVQIVTPDNQQKILSARSIVIAAGARPFVPPLPGLASVPYYTSDTLWEINALPARLLVLGGGPIGCELAQAFSRLGAQVTLVQRNARLLPKEDPDVSEAVLQAFLQDGIQVYLNSQVTQFQPGLNGHSASVQNDTQTLSLPFDAVLVALGRVANTRGYGLEELGLLPPENETIETNDYLQTLYPNIYACGDVAGPFQYTHVSSHQAWYASVNALFGRFKKFRADYRVIPHCTFIEPEVARVGLNEQEAQQQGIAYEVTRYQLEDLDRAIADGKATGFIK